VLLAAAALAWVAGSARADVGASPWHQGYSSKARLISAGASSEAASTQSGVLAGVEIAMSKGWKTYWRTPGDAGGVPPSFDWSQSENLATASVLFPAPRRFVDKGGETIGYKEGVVFPLKLEAKDPSKPVVLRLQLAYGVCLDICVPVEAELTLDLAPSNDMAAGVSPLDAAVRKLPRPATARRPLDPELISLRLDEAAGKPQIRIEARFAGTDKVRDVFVEAPDGIYVPMAKAAEAGDGGRQVFLVDLTGGGPTPAELKGKTLTVTLVGDSGATEVSALAN